MKRVALIFVVFAMCAVSFGCSTKSAYLPAPGTEQVDPTSQFNVGNISDSSGYQFAQDDKDAIILTDAMKTSLQSALSKHVPQNTTKQYLINVDILQYSPGNAFARWLAPGIGETKLTVEAEVRDEEGKTHATIPVSRSIAAGGGFTIGAWKYVFDDVAEEIVDIVTDIDMRKSEQ